MGTSGASTEKDPQRKLPTRSWRVTLTPQWTVGGEIAYVMTEIVYESDEPRDFGDGSGSSRRNEWSSYGMSVLDAIAKLLLRDPMEDAGANPGTAERAKKELQGIWLEAVRRAILDLAQEVARHRMQLLDPTKRASQLPLQNRDAGIS